MDVVENRVPDPLTRVIFSQRQMYVIVWVASRVEEGGRLLVGERPRLGVVWLRHTRPLVLSSAS